MSPRGLVLGDLRCLSFGAVYEQGTDANPSLILICVCRAIRWRLLRVGDWIEMYYI